MPRQHRAEVTAAGLKAIATDNRWASDDAKDGNEEHVQVGANSEVIRQTTTEVPTMDAARPFAPRSGTKLARLLELLQRDCGATLEELRSHDGVRVNAVAPRWIATPLTQAQRDDPERNA